MEPGDHLCCIYRSEEEHRSLLAPFLRRGLERGQKVLYIADAHTASNILAYLHVDGLDAAPFLERGQLVILASDEAYTEGGSFDPDRMIELLRGETERALMEGYRALRVSGEMSWALKGIPGSERLIEYEAKLNLFFPGSGCLALCQYDRRVFRAGLLLEVVTTHPLVVVGEHLYENFYYIPPEEYLGPDLEESRLEHWLRNLASHRKVREDLLMERRFSSELIDSLPLFFVAIDPQGRVLNMNAMMLQELGYTREEVVGREFAATFVPPEERPALARIFDILMRTRSLTVNVSLMKARDGQELVVEWHGKPVFREDGELEYFYGLGVDVTERTRAEEIMRRVNEELEAYARAISHDLRGPVANIQSAAQTMEKMLEAEGGEDAVLRELAEMITSSSRRAIELIEETLKMARERELSGRVGPVHVSALVREVVEERQDLIREKGVRVEVDDDLGELRASRAHLYQLFANLLDNALRFAPRDEGLVEVRKLGMNGEAIHYLVRDNGPGFQPEEFANLFKPFWKGREGRTGVGLSTVQRLVETYGGEIRAYNDGGACLEFTLRSYPGCERP
ncbi:MEDS domain-containing protein [Candidatus Solincola tengchongensis]|uniref:MEDS domain-containing protein n=1 Tax=Candidatus Solincola tengchongensis TaxID=2900693 RepID=UPI0025808AEA|nr:MEDS domain-containing protein [Candidatus Solincola tengchongensis]